MNKSFIPPDYAQVIPLIGSALVLTTVDIQKMVGTFQIFETVEEARLFNHDCSKQQHPKWHEENCRFCKTGYGL